MTFCGVENGVFGSRTGTVTPVAVLRTGSRMFISGALNREML